MFIFIYFCEINYDCYDYICVYMLLYLDVQMHNSSKHVSSNEDYFTHKNAQHRKHWDTIVHDVNVKSKKLNMTILSILVIILSIWST